MSEDKFVYWVSCNKFTVGIVTLGKGKEAIICKAPPIARKFLGQPFRNFVQWANRFGGLKLDGFPESG